MPVPLSQQIARSAACALTSGAAQPLAAVAAALERGRRAAEHGGLLPLPVLLDAGAFLEFAGREPVRRNSPPRARVQEYDKWLEEVRQRIAEAPRLWSEPEDASPSPAPLGDGVLLPLLLSCWWGGKGTGTSREWAEAYAALEASPERATQIHRAWSGLRSPDQEWSWWPGHPKKPSAEIAGHALLWSLFAAREPHFPERFDHAAGDLYLCAERPSPLPDQMRRIQQLKLRRREPEQSPQMRTAEEQDPWCGRVPLAALVPDSFDEVIHRIENHETPRLNSPQPNRHPRPVHVHLGWTAGFAALTREHGNLPPGPEPRGRATEAATAAALTLLLLEDWRAALRGLPLRFHLHRGAPAAPRSLDLGKGGARWWGGPLPPDGVVTAVFERPSLVQAASARPGWESASMPVTGWLCGCVAESDLPEMGFQLSPRIRLWTAPRVSPSGSGKPLLPAGMTHLIVLDPPRGQGWICQVWNSPDGRTCELRPLRERLPQPVRPDPSFQALRLNTLEVLLDVLPLKLR
jgi:hypothetical protein